MLTSRQAGCASLLHLCRRSREKPSTTRRNDDQAVRPQADATVNSVMRHTFFCIDGHTAGNPVRLIAGGAPILEGGTMSEKRRDFVSRFDWIRTGLMFEPRGHDMMSGGFLYPPTSADADISILFVET